MSAVDLIGGVFTLSEYVERVTTGPLEVPANAEGRERYAADSSEERAKWCGVSREAVAGEGIATTMTRIVRDGWPRGVALMSRVTASIEVPVPVSIRRHGEWADVGDDLEQQRVWTGDLEHAWRRTRKRAGNGPQRVRLLVDSIASATVKADSMRWRGVAAMVAADALTAAGYAVQVESVFEGYAGGARFAPRVIVKDYTQPLDLPALAATTACPGFFRFFGHAFQLTAQRIESRIPGMSVHEARSPTFEDGDTAAMFIAEQSIYSAPDAAAWVARVIGALDRVQAAAA